MTTVRFDVRRWLGLAALVACLPTEAVGAGQLLVCPPESSDVACDHRSIAKALSEVTDGMTVVIEPGTYREAAVLRAHRVTLKAMPGAHMTGVAAQGKAALVIKGDDITIEGLECSGIAVPDGNGACVRAEGRNLTLRRVHFHDSQEGLLGGQGRILIEDSLFERLGGDAATGLGQAHGLYVGHQVEDFVLRRSRILSSKEEGHEVKSRARRTRIEDNVIASLDGRDSRLIDLPNGGEIVIRGNLLQKGPNSSNPDVIGIGLERGRNSELDHAESRILIEGNTIVIDRRRPTRLVHVRGVPAPKLSGNVIVGNTAYREAGNTWFADRRAAGLPPYPALPSWPPP